MSKKSKKQKQHKKMYDGWLFPELRHQFSNKHGVNLECLKTLLCMTVGGMTAFRLSRPTDAESAADMSASSYCLVREIDSDLAALEIRSPEFRQFMTRLVKDDVFYREYIERLYAAIREKVLSGRHEEINGLFRQSQDFKRWMAETGVMLVQTHLIDGWLHPLSEFEKEGEQELMDLWAAASLLCGVATGRYQEVHGFSDPTPALRSLDELKVIDDSDHSFARIQAAKCVDDIYMRLIQDTKDKLEQKCEEAFNSKQ